MKTWTAHLHPTKPPVLLKEGFAWGGLVFGPFWLLARRGWIAGGITLAAAVAIGVLAEPAVSGSLLVLVNWCVGLFGNDLLRWNLGLRGYTEAHVVAARDADSAFLRLLTARPDLADLFLPDLLAPPAAWWRGLFPFLGRRAA